MNRLAFFEIHWFGWECFLRLWLSSVPSRLLPFQVWCVSIHEGFSSLIHITNRSNVPWRVDNEGWLLVFCKPHRVEEYERHWRIMNRHPQSEEDSSIQSIHICNRTGSGKRRTVRFLHPIKSAMVQLRAYISFHHRPKHGRWGSDYCKRCGQCGRDEGVGFDCSL